MQTTELEVLLTAQAGLARGARVTLVTVIKTWGTSPRPPGSLLAVCSDGTFAGSVSGGCIEDDLLQKLVQAPPQTRQVVRYGETEQERHHFRLPCGGTLELLLEPLQAERPQIDRLVEALQTRQTLTRSTPLAGEQPASLSAWQPGDTPQLDESVWRNVFGPVWRLLIIGAGQTSRYLAEMAQALGYRIIICDPRPEYRDSWNLTDCDWAEGYPDDAVRALQPDERTAIVALTHDPKLDDLALLEGLRSRAFYVGALGSVNTSRNRRQRLSEHFDFSPEEVARLRGPVGLPIGSKTPPEIAVAVLAELTALRHGIDLQAQLADTQ